MIYNALLNYIVLFFFTSLIFNCKWDLRQPKIPNSKIKFIVPVCNYWEDGRRKNDISLVLGTGHMGMVFNLLASKHHCYIFLICPWRHSVTLVSPTFQHSTFKSAVSSSKT
jgi:hypothetical protein